MAPQLFQERFEVVGERDLETNRLIILGMAESKLRGVERVAGPQHARRTVPVEPFADEGVPTEAGVEANLVAAARDQPDLDECGVVELLEGRPVRFGEDCPAHAPVGSHLLEVLLIPPHPVGEMAARRDHLSFDQGEVPAGRRVVGPLGGEPVVMGA